MRHLIVLVLTPLAAGAAEKDPALVRLAEEAEAFHVTAQRMLATEALTHQGRKSLPRFRPRVGAAAAKPAALPMIRREIVSEFGYAAMRERPGDLREYRKVVRVDGKAAGKPGRARLELAANMKSDDDRRRKQMLQDFEKFGMIGAATDFSQVMLLFRGSLLERYEFRHAARNQIGGEAVSILTFRQTGGEGGARVFHGKELAVVPLEGEIWIRDSDMRPLRIITRVVTEEDERPVLHTGETEYRLTKSGALVPVSVLYTRRQGETLMVENRAVYSDHQIFTVDTAIKFTADETVEPRQP
jgi:hypothetical protein